MLTRTSSVQSSSVQFSSVQFSSVQFSSELHLDVVNTYNMYCASLQAHPNQAAVKSSSMLGLGMLLVAMALAGMTFPNTQYFAKNASASKNMTAMDFYNGEESDSYFG